ncbi:MAG: helix-turn-helix transcriptional regulator, partial [Pseudomonadota bacterium]
RMLGNGIEQAWPTLTDVSRRLHRSERTLIRKLANRRTTYKQIVADERLRYASKLLRDAHYTVAEIADILGYREPANFCRAFKQWVGTSPTQFRRNRRTS